MSGSPDFDRSVPPPNLALANPYAPTSIEGQPLGSVTEDADAYRNQYLKHEASVKSIGTLYY